MPGQRDFGPTWAALTSALNRELEETEALVALGLINLADYQRRIVVRTSTRRPANRPREEMKGAAGEIRVAERLSDALGISLAKAKKIVASSTSDDEEVRAFERMKKARQRARKRGTEFG